MKKRLHVVGDKFILVNHLSNSQVCALHENTFAISILECDDITVKTFN